MTTLSTHQASLANPERPTSIQPGGTGWCMQLELAWGRLRRRYLRRFRPAYVAKMEVLRQGECPNCPHHIIDPRDLKFYRNVCGYWFRPEDDKFRWRGRLGLARAGLAEIVCLCLAGGAVSVGIAVLALLWHPAFWLPCLLVVLFCYQLVYFFRDPQRRIPADADAFLSPADGTVSFIGEVDEPEFPHGRAFCISIFLSVFNVHVNRVPRPARVTDIRYFRGEFLDARHPECGQRNEQLWLDLEEPSGRKLRVKQISGAIARRIVCELRLGEEMKAGQRFGMIKFGSRTNLLLPLGETLDLGVKVGDKVQGGSTILARLRTNLDV
jgi:phosphatidylserine decarboxylase